MQQFWRKISCDVALQIISDESKLERLDDNEDAIVAPDKVISVAELIEDELILAMPMIPRHEEGQCPESDYSQDMTVLHEIREVREVREVQTTYRPFADLAKTIDKQKT
jgi:uncharacterized protein